MLACQSANRSGSGPFGGTGGHGGGSTGSGGTTATGGVTGTGGATATGGTTGIGAAPRTTASPDAATTYQQAIDVTLTPDAPAKTYYTTDGSEPTAQSSLYAGPITLEQTTTLKFFSVDAAGHREATVTTTYSIDMVRILLLETGSQ